MKNFHKIFTFSHFFVKYFTTTLFGIGSILHYGYGNSCFHFLFFLIFLFFRKNIFAIFTKNAKMWNLENGPCHYSFVCVNSWNRFWRFWKFFLTKFSWNFVFFNMLFSTLFWGEVIVYKYLNDVKFSKSENAWKFSEKSKLNRY